MSKVDFKKVAEVIIVDENGGILDRFDFSSVVFINEKGEKPIVMFKKKPNHDSRCSKERLLATCKDFISSVQKP